MFRLFERLGGGDIHCVQIVGFISLERLSSVDHHLQRLYNADHNQARRFLAGIFARGGGCAVVYNRLVLFLSDLDRDHPFLRLVLDRDRLLERRFDLEKSETFFTVTLRGVVPPRPEREKNRKGQNTPPRAKRNENDNRSLTWHSCTGRERR